jgi:hypothetical protein
MNATSALTVDGYTVVVAAPAHMMARSARIHSKRVLEATATRWPGLHADGHEPGRQPLHLIADLPPRPRLPGVAVRKR